MYKLYNFETQLLTFLYVKHCELKILPSTGLRLMLVYFWFILASIFIVGFNVGFCYIFWQKLKDTMQISQS